MSIVATSAVLGMGFPVHAIELLIKKRSLQTVDIFATGLANAHCLLSRYMTWTGSNSLPEIAHDNDGVECTKLVVYQSEPSVNLPMDSPTVLTSSSIDDKSAPPSNYCVLDTLALVGPKVEPFSAPGFVQQ